MGANGPTFWDLEKFGVAWCQTIHYIMMEQMKKPSLIFLSFLFFLTATSALEAFAQKRLHPEKWYRDQWCAEAGGKAEVRMPDGCWCDCLTETHAIEVDFGNKWYEAVGQSLSYAIQTNKRAGIVLIIEQPKDRKHWIRLNTVIEHYKLPIDTWEVGKDFCP